MIKWYGSYQDLMPVFVKKLFEIDNTELHLIFFSTVLALGVLTTIPGIRGNARKYACLRYSVWYFTLFSVCFGYFCKSWLYNEVCFQNEENEFIKVKVRIGLQNMNISNFDMGYHFNEEFSINIHDERIFKLENLQSHPEELRQVGSWIQPFDSKKRHWNKVGRILHRAGSGSQTILLIGSILWIISVILTQFDIEAGVKMTSFSGFVMKRGEFWFGIDF